MVTLPIRYVSWRLLPAIDVGINGTRAVMLLNTNSTQMTLTPDAARTRGLKDFAVNGHLENRKDYMVVWGTTVKEFSIGRLRAARTGTTLVFGSTRASYPYDGVIGAPMLFQWDVEIDLHDKRLRLFASENCENAKLRPWAESTTSLDFNSYHEDANPHFNVLVNGKEIDAVIDTGIERSYLQLDDARRAGIDVKDQDARQIADGIQTSGDRTPRWSVPVKTLQLGGERLRDIELDVIDPLAASRAGLHLGRDFLRAHRVLFAMTQRKLYIAYVGGELFPRPTAVQPWMILEAENGNPDAQFLLSQAGMPQSRKWLVQAAGQGHALARRAMALDDRCADNPMTAECITRQPFGTPAEDPGTGAGIVATFD